METTTVRPRRTRAITARKSARRVKKVKPYDPVEGLTRYDERFLECRDLGHVWRIMGYYRHQDQVRRQLACRRCPTVSTDLWRSNGERITRRYRYPADYKVIGGTSRAEVRIEQIHRAKIYETEGDMIAALFTK